MKRNGFLLGFFSTSGQVLLLRELVSAFHGDELFIGTALFGWLLALALGASLGERIALRMAPPWLFAAGAVLLPLTVTLIRLSPTAAADLMGEAVPFSKAATISIFLMAPVSFISGALFAGIARRGATARESIVMVYLYEGIGAFVGGLLTALVVGWLASTLGVALAVATLVLMTGAWHRGRPVARVALMVIFLGTIHSVTPTLDYRLETEKHPGYQIAGVFDTPYSRQVIARRRDAVVLITDNGVEATHPDPLAAETQLVPPLLYSPDARRLLLLGRSEFGVAALADSLPALTLDALDPRRSLSVELDRTLQTHSSEQRRIHDDPLAFFAGVSDTPLYDIITISPGALDSYRNSRLLTPAFLRRARLLLRANGILYYASPYDSDRYLTEPKRRILSAVYTTLKSVFRYVVLWPGETTLFFASDGNLLEVPYDSVLSRAARLSFRPQFLNEYYLFDRFEERRIEELERALLSEATANSLNRPILSHLQATFRAWDRGSKLMTFLVETPLWILILPALLVVIFAVTFVGAPENRTRRFGWFLYLVAGAASLALELISFYVYQSAVGSLYTEMAVLVGTFMMGLALGTYWAKRRQLQWERVSLPVLIVVTATFLATWHLIPGWLALAYHLLFLLIVAAATGMLFVAATRRCYAGNGRLARGIGYACEVLGSAISALVATTILLPIIGLTWLLVALLGILALALAGSWRTAAR